MPDILSCTRQTLTILGGTPHLPPIRPLEQTRWVWGWVAHCSLRIAEVLVVTAESVRWFSQADGAYCPGRRWHSPNRWNFSGTHLRLTHLGFQMKGLFKRQEPFDRFLTALLLFVLNNCVLKAQRDNWALGWYLWICHHNCECHAQTGTCMMRLQSSGTQWPQSHNENDDFPGTVPIVSSLHCCVNICFRQAKQTIFL